MQFEMVRTKNPQISEAVDSLYELSADEEARALYEHRLKAWRDIRSWNEDHYEDGMQKGIKMGVEMGVEKTARNALAMGLSVEVVQQMTGLNIDTIQSFASGA